MSSNDESLSTNRPVKRRRTSLFCYASKCRQLQHYQAHRQWRHELPITPTVVMACTASESVPEEAFVGNGPNSVQGVDSTCASPSQARILYHWPNPVLASAEAGPFLSEPIITVRVVLPGAGTLQKNRYAQVWHQRLMRLILAVTVPLYRETQHQSQYYC